MKLLLGFSAFGLVLLCLAYPLTTLISETFQTSEQQGLATAAIFITMIPIILGGSFFFSNYFANLVVTPMRKISASSNKLAKGDFDVDIDIKASEDEIGDVIKSYQELLLNFARPIRKLKKVSMAIAQGNLDQEVNIKGKGEMKELIDSYVLMIEKMQYIVKGVQKMSEKVSISSQELASSAEQMNATAQQVSSSTQQISTGSNNQAKRVEETVNVIGSMTKAVEDVASDSNTAKDTSSQASEIAGVGRESVEESVKMMKQIHETVNSSANVISELGERSKEISQIVDVITNITDQTNLLALNAAIEAARAGEHGRGFAVVAEEVKNLAEDSKEAADKISVIINDIQTNTERAVKSMNQGTQEVSDGMEIVSKAGNALKNVAEMSKTTAELVEGISNITEQQKAGTDMVATTIDEIASIAEESASATEESASGMEELTASMEEITARAQELSEMAVVLQKGTSGFNIDGAKKGKIGLTPLRKPASTLNKLRSNRMLKLPKKVAAALESRGVGIPMKEAA
jgi:methyl-accepting chemotaxis protein